MSHDRQDKGKRVWQVLDVGSIWMKEFASALAGQVDAVAWEPVMLRSGALQNWMRTDQISDPPLKTLRFPLQRGYSNDFVQTIFHFERKVVQYLNSKCSDPHTTPLICTTPYYAPVAEKWPGPSIYYATDLTFAYAGLNPDQVNKLDKRMCNVAAAVCPNSHRIAEYFIQQANCDPAKITVVPNATRESNTASAPLLERGSLPAEISDLKQPIAGVIGNLAGNMDWILLAEAIRITPEMDWVFVGPTSMLIPDSLQAQARLWCQGHARFVGAKPYRELQSYARAFDVAILPYLKKEPTFSGSSTRFYEHLAACRPMISTRGFAELLEKPPLVVLADTALEISQSLETLRRQHFSDGHEYDRWSASKSGTWEERARTVRSTLGWLDS